ncbi:MAG: UTP--glucose-1-phosphate uridylyltransferase [Rickettsiales bacterium]|nr:UTP--glucose-1-phosphate uridylyltransferase [Rickettsiales bacterium]|tara:strand:- start:152 stop:1012 length:861 start_codon:yes stop_codon:yes gene_type:complete
MTKVKSAIFPIAGLGTRFLPATKSIPKEMLTVGDSPVIEWAVKEAHLSGIENFIFVSSPNKKSIVEYFKRLPSLERELKKKKKFKDIELITRQTKYGKITTVFQDQPKGLGHAIWCAKKFIKEEKFAVILPDDIILSKIPTLKEMIKLSEQKDCSVVALEEVPLKDTQKYGIVSLNKKFKNHCIIESIVEKPLPSNAPSNLSVIGRYILDRKIFNFLDLKKKGVGNEIQLTDGIDYILKGSTVMGFYTKGKRFDCGSKLGYIYANLEFGLNDKNIKKDLLSYLRNL